MGAVATGHAGRLFDYLLPKTEAPKDLPIQTTSGKPRVSSKYVSRFDPRRAALGKRSVVVESQERAAPPSMQFTRMRIQDPTWTWQGLGMIGAGEVNRVAAVVETIPFELAPHSNPGTSSAVVAMGNEGNASSNRQAAPGAGTSGPRMAGMPGSGTGAAATGVAANVPSAPARAPAGAAKSAPSATAASANVPAAEQPPAAPIVLAEAAVPSNEPAQAEATPEAPASLPSNFVQTDGKTVIDTLLNADTVDILGGRLGGHGTIQTATLTIGAGGTLAPGNSPGILTINGNVVQSGVLEIEIAGTNNDHPQNPQYDQLIVNGNVVFEPNSVLKFVMYDGFQPHAKDEIEFLTANAVSGLELLTYSISGLPAGLGYQVYATQENGKTELYVRFYSTAYGSQPAAQGEVIYYDGRVPEPSTLALYLLGLTLLAWPLRLRLRQATLLKR